MKIWVQYGLLMLILFLTKIDIWAQQVQAKYIIPAYSVNSDLLPVLVKIVNDNQSIETSFSGNYTLNTIGAAVVPNTIKINKGIGSTTASVTASGAFTLSITGLDGQTTVPYRESQALIEVQGQLDGEVTWNNDSDYRITDDLIIPTGSSLKIKKGTNILIDEKINIFVYGTLTVNGEEDQPVMFLPFNPTMAWGGIQLMSNQDTTFIQHCFFIKGGGNENFWFGHSESQPVFMIHASIASIRYGYFIDNIGKAIGGLNSQVFLSHCVFSRCDTGGEYHACNVVITDSWFTDIPDEDTWIEDDDNDAVYISGNHPEQQEPSLVSRCCFINGEDDGIDHNGANLLIKNCWIEGFYHEGIAASNNNIIRIFNTLVKDCGQGIEAGYGNPQVEIDHCSLVGNEVGIRFGDSYDWGCEGHIQVSNSILHANSDNVLNFDLLIQGPVPGAIDIAYTMTNDPDYDYGPGCITGTPQFNEHFLLLPESIGTGQASDGSNLGLVHPVLQSDNSIKTPGFFIFPNPCSHKFVLHLSAIDQDKVTVLVHDVNGRLIFSKTIRNREIPEYKLLVNTGFWEQGIYFLSVSINNRALNSFKIIKIDE